MKLPDDLPTLFKSVRKELKLNQKDFGKTLGVTQGVISRYENGTIQNPSPQAIIRVANIYLERMPGAKQEGRLAHQLTALAQSADPKVIEALTALISALSGGSTSPEKTQNVPK